jgi:hypothetical protein
MSNTTRDAQALKDLKEAQRLLVAVKGQFLNDHPAYTLLTVAINDAYEAERAIQGWWP